MPEESDEHYHLRPAGAPPLLSMNQIVELCSRGWLNFDLPSRLQDDINQLQSTAADFFNQDPELKVNTSAIKQLEEEGYYHVPNEKEYVTFRREVPGPLALQDKVRGIWSQIAALLHRMLCDMSRAGGLDTTAWDEVIGNALYYPDSKLSLRNSTTLLRLFRYDPGTGNAERHTDLGLLTMCIGSGAGLEVLDPLSWPAAWYPSATCTVLVGETLRKLSSDNIRAGVHRVVPNPLGRQSLVFALRPDLSATVNLEQFGGQGSVELRSLFNSIKGSKYNVNAKQEDRQRQKDSMSVRLGSSSGGAAKNDSSK